VIKIITWTKRLVLTLSFLALIATNVLTLTHSAFNAALSGLMSATFGVQTVSDALHRKHTTASAKRKAATRRFGARLTSRTKRVAAQSMAAIPGEAIPLIGLTLLIGGTTYELYEACNSMKDMDKLYLDMGMTDETPDDVLHSVCDPSLPNVENYWDDTIEKGGIWLGKVYESVKPPLPLPHAFINFP